MRHYSIFDQFCIHLDQGLKAVFGKTQTTGRPSPAKSISEANLSVEQKKHAAAIMRINHTGEVCAQALYQGQAIASRTKAVKEKMHHAAVEEGDHLAWCSARIMELGSHTSYLNPFWYTGSLMIGLTAGLVGDKWSLGFLAETECQVVKHLENQMKLLPAEDQKSQTILQQMRVDEAKHQEDAIRAGAAELPSFIKKIMQWTSAVMVKLSYRV